MASKAKCTLCLGEGIKESILQDYPHLADLLSKVRTCPEPDEIDPCTKKKSAYQEHIKNCFAQKNVHGFSPETMKLCAKEWREKNPK